MKTKCLAFIFLLFNSFTFSQVNIEGQVKDVNTKKPIAFATVVVLSESDSALTMSLSDEKGFFNLLLDRGQYKLVFRSIGYEEDTIEVNAMSDQSLGIVYLTEQVHSIDQVTVSASLNRQDLDRDVYLVTKEMKSRSSNINELLEQTPGVNYDRYNNKLSVDGETNILILVNGLRKSYDYVQALNPERIWKIEVIRDPAGRYGLEGYAAVINIILKDNFRGVETFTQVSAIISPNYEYEHILGTQGSINLNYTQNKLNIYTNTNFSTPLFPLNMTVTRFYSDGMAVVKTPLNGSPSLIYRAQLLNMTAGFDYKINPLHTVSIETGLQNMPNHNHTYSLFNFKQIDSLPDGQVDIFYELTKQVSPQQDLHTTLFYQGMYGANLAVQGDLLVGRKKTQNYNMIRTYFDSSAVNYDDLTMKTGDFITSSQTDYLKSNIEASYSLNNFTITGGGGYNYRYLQSVTSIYNLEGENYSWYDESRIRAYMYLTWKPVDKFNVKAGTAFENYNIKNQSIGKSMQIWQPYFDLKYQPINLLTLTLKYRASSNYPTAEQLNPAERQYAYRINIVGNPELMPSTQHKVSLKANVLGGLLSIEQYYNFTDNYIAQVFVEPNTQDLDGLITYQNVAKYYDYGTKLNFMIPFSKKIIMQSNATFYHQGIEYQATMNKIKDWRANVQLIFYDPKIVTTGILYQNLTSKRLTAQGYSTQNNDFVGMFVQKQMFDNKFSFMLFYILPLNPTPGWLDYDNTTFTRTPLYDETSVIDLSVLKNLLVFQVSYRFSKGKTLKVEKDIQKAEDIQVKSLF